ncbi:lysozyme inhibitor LprI family protein [Paenibacillus azoreducens]|uniref:lysozyme inhibitor LprI family protein n=1 Tax=Paenibacillus azoreducens TaxID=116718 RepID=UPI0039F49092
MMKTKIMLSTLIMTALVGCTNTANEDTTEISSPQIHNKVQQTKKVSSNSNITASKNSKIENKENSSYVDSRESYGSYDLSNEFTKLIQSNPIDRAYNKEADEVYDSPNYSTHKGIQLEGKYADLWDKELNAIYKKLLAKLNPKEKKLLIESQKGWLQYHLKESDFVQETFQGNSLNNIGSQGLINMQSAIKHRLRDRTIQLFEYDYMLGGNAKFIYRN